MKSIDSEQEKMDIYNWAKDLFPIGRSLSGDGFVKTLEYINDLLPELRIESIVSGTQVFDWKIPQEWNIHEAWVKDSQGRKIVDYSDSNLHIVGYSEPVHKKINREEFMNHLYTLPNQPEAVPYVTSYYRRTWGFCMAHNELEKIQGDEFEIYIDSSLQDGKLHFGELYIPGECTSEILFSTYLCHPSMANNELSGPVVATALARWIKKNPKNKYSYRFLFLPETIGSISYIEKHLMELKNNVMAGWVLTCLGDNRNWSYLPSREGNTLADKLSTSALTEFVKEFKSYTWLDRGSDERQYCSPGIDLPVASIMRSKYGEYPEYHTSLDDMSLISKESLNESVDLFISIIKKIESRITYKTRILCEPQLGKRNLYPTLSKKGSANDSKNLLNVISYCDGKSDISEISDLCKLSISKTESIINILLSHQLIDKINCIRNMH